MNHDPTLDREASTDEPDISGTLVLTTLLLIMIFGFWVMMYFTLLGQ